MYKFYNVPNLDILNKIIGPSPSIKFSSAFDLNDPNELKFSIRLDTEQEAMRDCFLADNPGKTLMDYESWARQISSNFEWYTAQQQRGSLGMMITLTCFTESYDNNLMWSHYANNHTGICVEYQPDIFKFLGKLPGYLWQNHVTYCDEPPVVNGAQFRNDDTIQKMVFTKQSEWAYEKEARIVLISKENSDFIILPQTMIKRVIVGSRATRLFIGEVLQCIAGSNIKLFYAINSGTSYKVHLAEHKEGTMYTRTFWGNKDDQ